MYFSIGYNCWNMDHVDMAFWGATSSTSNVMNDLWSKSEESIVVDKTNPYTTTTVVGTSSTTFTSKRALDTGLTNSYVIELDKDLAMCFAFSTRTSALKYHGNDRGVFRMRLNSDGTSTVLLAQPKTWQRHAWIMLYCWTIACLLEVFSNRYWKHWFRVHQWIHSLVGYTTAILTAYSMYIAFLARSKSLMLTYHPIGGYLTFLFMLPVMLLGMITMFKRKFLRYDWNSKSVLFWARIHAYLAYFLIFLSQATISAGIYVYYFQLL